MFIIRPIVYSSNYHFTIYPSKIANQVIRQVSFVLLRLVASILLSYVYHELAIGFNILTGIIQSAVLERKDTLRFTVFEGLVITLTISAIVFSFYIFFVL